MRRVGFSRARKVLSSLLALSLALSMVIVPGVAGAATTNPIAANGRYRVAASILKMEEDSNSSANDSVTAPVYIDVANGVAKVTVEWKIRTVNMGPSNVMTVVIDNLNYYAGPNKTLETAVSVNTTQEVTRDAIYSADTPPVAVSQGGTPAFRNGDAFPKSTSFTLPAYAVSNGIIPLSMDIFGMPGAPHQTARLVLDLDNAVNLTASQAAIDAAEAIDAGQIPTAQYETLQVKLAAAKTAVADNTKFAPANEAVAALKAVTPTVHPVQLSVVQRGNETASMADQSLNRDGYISTLNGKSTLLTDWTTIDFNLDGSDFSGNIKQLGHYKNNNWDETPLTATVESTHTVGSVDNLPKDFSFELTRPSQKYVYILMTINIPGFPLPAQQARIKIASGVDAPANPVIESVKATSYDKATVAWTKVAGASGYVVEYQKAGTSTWLSKKVAGGSVVSTSLTGLATGKKYNVRVRAYTDAANDPNPVYSAGYSKTLTVTANLAKVAGVKTKKASKSSIKVSWKKVAGANKYEVWQKIGKGKWKKIKTTTASSFTKKGLKKGKAYQYKVRAYRTTDKAYGSFSKVAKRTLK